MGPLKVNQQVPLAPWNSSHRDKIVWGSLGATCLGMQKIKLCWESVGDPLKPWKLNCLGWEPEFMHLEAICKALKTVVKLALKCLQSRQDILMPPFQRNRANLVPDIHGTRPRFCKMKQEGSFLWTLRGGKLQIVVQGACVTSPLPASWKQIASLSEERTSWNTGGRQGIWLTPETLSSRIWYHKYYLVYRGKQLTLKWKSLSEKVVTSGCHEKQFIFTQ